MTVSITCPKCGRTSYNPNDIKEQYCGNCHQYHEFMTLGGLQDYRTDSVARGSLAPPAPPIPGRRSARPGPLVALFRRFDMIPHSYGPLTAAGLILLALAVVAVLGGR